MKVRISNSDSVWNVRTLHKIAIAAAVALGTMIAWSFVFPLVSQGSTVHHKIAPIPQCKPIIKNGTPISTVHHETEGNVSKHAINCA